MRFVTSVLAAFVVLAPLGAARASGNALPAAEQSFLEGEWHGVTVDTNANKLCTKESPPPTILTFEFKKSGGVSLFDNGTQGESGRRKVIAASAEDGLMSVTLDGQIAPFTFRKDGQDRMALVRDSASLGMPVDVMVFKRCKAPADSSQIALDTSELQKYAAEMPGDFPYFVDTRIAALTPNACTAGPVQYLFFGLVGPSEYRVSRWNSFDLSDLLDKKKKPAFPIDATGDWLVTAATVQDGVVSLTVRDYEKADAPPQTLTLTPKDGGRIAIPEWNREYVRCKGFDKRS